MSAIFSYTEEAAQRLLKHSIMKMRLSYEY